MKSIHAQMKEIVQELRRIVADNSDLLAEVRELRERNKELHRALADEIERADQFEKMLGYSRQERLATRASTHLNGSQKVRLYDET